MSALNLCKKNALSAMNIKQLLLLSIAAFSLSVISAQSDIKIRNLKINSLDKQNRKQGDWVFFDKSGNAIMSCFFQDDSCSSPIIFYDKGDTTFVKLQATDSIEPFILYKNNKHYFGKFIYTSDTVSSIEIEQDSTVDDHIVSEIQRYKDIRVTPVYYFAQKKMIDYLSAGFYSSNMILNKPINVLLTISSSGLVIKVEFPKKMNNLSPDEETELHWIYSRMPRWQPYFVGNKVRECKILLSNNSSLSVTSFN